MNNILKKLSSRKFWITLISVIAGIAQLAGADGELVNTVSGALLSLVPSIVYVVTGARLDEKK